MTIQELTTTECLNVLARLRLGRLACARDGQPYIVPIYYAFEDPFIYGFTTPGMKLEWMRSNPRVCVEVDEVADRDQWTSVVVFGSYEELVVAESAPQAFGPGRHAADSLRPDSAEMKRAHAYELLDTQAEWWEPGCVSSAQRDPGGPVNPVFYRIAIEQVSGRRAKSAAGASTQLHLNTPDNQGWLKSVLHAWAARLGGKAKVR